MGRTYFSVNILFETEEHSYAKVSLGNIRQVLIKDHIVLISVQQFIIAHPVFSVLFRGIVNHPLFWICAFDEDCFRWGINDFNGASVKLGQISAPIEKIIRFILMGITKAAPYTKFCSDCGKVLTVILVVCADAFVGIVEV